MSADANEIRARARLAGFLYLAVNAVYISSLLASTAASEAIRRPAVALQPIATAATIALAWSLYQLLKGVNPGLALMALLFRVVDRTGLKRRHEFTLRFSPPAVRSAASPDDPPDFFTALHEQLGLKLEATRAPVDTLVLDHLERPAEN